MTLHQTGATSYHALRGSDKAFYLVKGCNRKWLNKDSDQEDNEDRRGAGIDILWPIVDNPHYQEALARAKDRDHPDSQNICPIVEYGLRDGAIFMWMGDLETEFMDNVRDAIRMPSIDILFAPHHGRDSGRVPAKWLKQLNPKVIVIGEAPSEHLNYYAGYHTITQNSGGDITFECVKGQVNVYVSNRDYSVDFLENEGMGNNYGGYYIGTLNL